MGYYSYFTLCTDVDNESVERDIIDHFRSSNEDAQIALDDEGYSEEHCTWYDASKELAEFSKIYPFVLFTLYIDGEDSEDFRQVFAKNGKHYVSSAEIMYPNFDKTKLK